MSISTLKGKYVDVHLWTDLAEVESGALDQLRNIAAMQWVYKHVAVMPDVHYGKGATVGSVIAMKDAVSPSAVGVDIGCGMAALKTNLSAHHLPEDLGRLRSAIEAAIPVGFNGHDRTTQAARIWTGWRGFTDLNPNVKTKIDRAMAQMGTLGGGNHFIELCLDTEDAVWMVLHSGSRNIGKEIAEAHIKVAKTLEHNSVLQDRDLSVFLAGTEEFQRYRHDLLWAQEYAMQNRTVMLALYLNVMRQAIPSIRILQTVNCHHNYVSEETHYGEDVLVTRKGAISAREGEWGIIPGSMGTRSYIVQGLGNAESFHSASHGAGRVMSRTAAKKQFTVEDLVAQTEGVECSKDAGKIDEIPGAYKSIEQVMANQSDLVSIQAELKQVLCVKG